MFYDPLYYKHNKSDAAYTATSQKYNSYGSDYCKHNKANCYCRIVVVSVFVFVIYKIFG